MLFGLPHRALVTSLFVAFLLMTHIALMTTEEHAAAMGATHSLHSGALQAIAATAASHHNTGEHQAPTTVLDDCPAQQAILPLLLLVALTLLATGATGWRPIFPRQHHRVSDPPFPLTVPRRLALIQVFLI